MIDQISEFLYRLIPGLKRTTSVPGTVIHHPTLGRLVFDVDGLWFGSRRVLGYEIGFRIADDGNGIDGMEAESCESTLRSFDDTLDKAVSFMSFELELNIETVLSRFIPTDIWGFARHYDGSFFYLSFSDAEDEYKLWRVQFENGKATDVGYDD